MGRVDWAAEGVTAACLGLSIDIMPPLGTCELGPAPATLPVHRTAHQLLENVTAGLWRMINAVCCMHHALGWQRASQPL